MKADCTQMHLILILQLWNPQLNFCQTNFPVCYTVLTLTFIRNYLIILAPDVSSEDIASANTHLFCIEAALPPSNTFWEHLHKNCYTFFSGFYCLNQKNNQIVQYHMYFYKYNSSKRRIFLYIFKLAYSITHSSRSLLCME